MKNFILIIGTMIAIAIIAVLGGTIVWLIWPSVFPIVFPLAVENGIIPAKIPWWTAVSLTWICGILIKSTNTK